MTKDELMLIGTKETFDRIIDDLCLTDRQKKIAYLRYLRGWAYADISAEIGYSRQQ